MRDILLIFYVSVLKIAQCAKAHWAELKRGASYLFLLKICYELH